MRLDIRPDLHRLAIHACCTALFLFTFAPPASAQNWWNLNSERELAEKGKLKEIVGKKKVYLNVSFSDTRPNSQGGNSEQNSINRAVNDAIFAHKDLKKVTYPEEADFAIVVRAATAQGTGDRGPNFSLLLDSEAEVSLEVLVLVPGAMQPDGTHMPRIVWDASSPNTQIEAAAAARFTIDGFLWELKKLRDKK